VLTVVVRTGLLPQQIDGFPDDCKRSCKGALHIRSGTLPMTVDEWKHIQSSRPDLVPSLRVICETKAPLPAPYVPPDDPPGAETETEIPGTTEESKPPKRPKKRRFLPDAH